MPLRCCAYLRKSREDEERERWGPHKTLERHKEIVASLAEMDGNVIQTWHMEVVSGETIAGRPEMRALLAEVANNMWDMIYVVEASRLGRGGGTDQEKILNSLRYTDTILRAQHYMYRPDSPQDMRMLKMELRSSEDELEFIRTRLQRGKIQSVKNGCWMSTKRCPYGWKSERIEGKWQLVPHPEQHKWMQMVYDLLEDGGNYSAIAAQYNRLGVPKARGGYHWTPTDIRNMALNKANWGYVEYGKRKIVRKFDPETFEVHKASIVNPDKHIIAKGLHYDKCQDEGNPDWGIPESRALAIIEQVRERTPVRTDRSLRNPLSGLIKCGKCNYALQYHNYWAGRDRASVYYRYEHKAKKQMHRECEGCCSADVGHVMDVLIEGLKEIAADLVIATKQGDGMSSSRRKKVIEDLEREMERCRAAETRAMDAYEAGVYSIDVLRQRKAENAKRMEELQRSIDEQRNVEPSRERDQQRIVAIHRCIEALRDDTLSPEVKNNTLKEVIERIDYYREIPKGREHTEIRLEITLRK